MTAGPSPGQLLADARATLADSARWGGAWQRAVAFLARQALEEAVSDVWDGPSAAMAGCPMTAQLICLPYYLDDPEVGVRARHCWHALSSACHAHPYELAPTVGELAGWLAEVESMVVAGARV